MLIQFRANFESAKLMNEFDEILHSPFKPELALLPAREQGVAYDAALRNPCPPFHHSDGRSTAQIVPVILGGVERDLLFCLFHLHCRLIQVEVNRSFELARMGHASWKCALARLLDQIGDERWPDKAGAQRLRLNNGFAG